MVKNIVKDISFLKNKSVDATKEDLYICNELIETLTFNKSRCVGMAANMIGYNKNIIIVDDNGTYIVMINPLIVKTSAKYYNTEEGCLSLEGTRPCKRYESIKVKYFDMNFKIKIKTYDGFTSQIIQHEIDHLNGIII